MPFTELLKDRPDAAEFAPPGLVHYETGPTATRMVEREGRLWAVTYHARYDGIGWRVTGATVEPAEKEAYSLREGDIIEVRCKVYEDHGIDVLVRVEGAGYCQKFWTKRSNITRIHRPAEP